MAALEIPKRTVWRRLHLWLAVAAALPLLATAATGTLLAFQPWLERWLEPAHFAVERDGDPPLGPAKAVAALRGAVPDVRLNYVSAPDPGGTRPYVVYASAPSSDGGPERFMLFLDPYTGEVSRRDEPGPVKVIEKLHRNLTAGQAGRYWVGGSTLALIVLSLAGLYLWWPMRRATLRRVRRQGDALGWHNLLGLASLPVVLIVAFTGITLTFNAQVMPLVRFVTASPPLPQPPAIEPVDDPALDLPGALAVAKARNPEAIVTGFSDRGRDEPYNIRLRYPGEMHPSGWEQVFVHPATGAIVGRVNAYEHSLGGAYQRSWFVWHTGVMLGTPGRVVWSLVCVLLLVTTVTGFVRWYGRAGNRRRSRERNGAGSVSRA